MGDSYAPPSITSAHDVRLANKLNKVSYRYYTLRFIAILTLHNNFSEIPIISQDEQWMKIRIKYIMYRCLEHSYITSSQSEHTQSLRYPRLYQSSIQSGPVIFWWRRASLTQERCLLGRDCPFCSSFSNPIWLWMIFCWLWGMHERQHWSSLWYLPWWVSQCPSQIASDRRRRLRIPDWRWHLDWVLGRIVRQSELGRKRLSHDWVWLWRLVWMMKSLSQLSCLYSTKQLLRTPWVHTNHADGAWAYDVSPKSSSNDPRSTLMAFTTQEGDHRERLRKYLSGTVRMKEPGFQVSVIAEHDNSTLSITLVLRVSAYSELLT